MSELANRGVGRHAAGRRDESARAVLRRRRRPHCWQGPGCAARTVRLGRGTCSTHASCDRIRVSWIMDRVATCIIRRYALGDTSSHDAARAFGLIDTGGVRHARRCPCSNVLEWQAGLLVASSFNQPFPLRCHMCHRPLAPPLRLRDASQKRCPERDVNPSVNDHHQAQPAGSRRHRGQTEHTQGRPERNEKPLDLDAQEIIGLATQKCTHHQREDGQVRRAPLRFLEALDELARRAQD